MISQEMSETQGGQVWMPLLTTSDLEIDQEVLPEQEWIQPVEAHWTRNFGS